MVTTTDFLVDPKLAPETVQGRVSLLNSLGLRQAYEDMERLADDIGARTAALEKARAEIAELSARMDLREAELGSNGIEGKNKEERDSRLKLALEADEHARRLLREMAEARGALADETGYLETAKRRFQALARRLEVSAAALAFLANGEDQRN